MVPLKCHQNYHSNQWYLYQYQEAYPQLFFSFLLLYTSLQPDYLHLLNQSFLVHQPSYILNSILEPFLPLHHKQRYHREDEIYLKPHQQFLQTFYKLYLIVCLVHAYHIKSFYELVLNHLLHQEELLKQLQTLNNQCTLISSPLLCLLQ